MNESTAFDKLSFAQFIVGKRKEACLTQHELAARLYVSDTAVSKWERGLSFPDITMVPAICKALNISEHEFFTACDDQAASQQKKEAGRYRLLAKGMRLALLIAYGITLVTCFICELAVSRQLAWFFIVLCSIAIAFSITHLPLLVKKRRGAVSLLAVTALTFLLLFICFLYTGEGGVISLGFPITAACFGGIWLSAFAITRKRLNAAFKVAVTAASLSGFIFLMDCVLTGGVPVDYFSLSTGWLANNSGDKIVFFTGLVVAVVSTVIGVIRLLCRPAKK